MNKLKSSAKNIALTPVEDLFSSEEIVHEHPQAATVSSDPESASPALEEPMLENPIQANSTQDIPTLETPMLESPTLLNTNRSNKNKEKKNEINLLLSTSRAAGSFQMSRQQDTGPFQKIHQRNRQCPMALVRRALPIVHYLH